MPNGWASLPEVLGFCNTARLTRPRTEIAEVHPGRELLQGVICGQAFNLHPVQLCQLVTGIGNLRLQGSIIGQYDQTFRISIQPAGGIYPGDWNVIGQRGSPSGICKLGQHAIGLVEQYESAQTEQPLPKTLQKRCDSG